jgi:hypothetical protein
MNEPVDELHQECLAALRQIRAAYHYLRVRAAEWRPRPMPEGWRR